MKKKIAIITGSSSGLGKSIAINFAKEGYHVIVNYNSSEEKAKKVVQTIEQNGGTADLIQADVSSEEDVNKLYDEVLSKHKRLDVLVSNAGLQQDNSFEEMTLDQWNKVINVNLTGAFLCAQGAVKAFKKYNTCEEHEPLGKIIFISSVHEIIPWAGHVNYAASKGGLNLLMKSLALELGDEKIRVNSVAPGAIKTPINESVWSDEDSMKKLLKLIPYSRIGFPQDVSNATLWLASNKSDYVTGTTVVVDGGMTTYPGFKDNG